MRQKEKKKIVRFYVHSVRCSSGKSEAKNRPQTLKDHPDLVKFVQTGTVSQITDIPSLKLQTCLDRGVRMLFTGIRMATSLSTRKRSKEPEEYSVNHCKESRSRTSLYLLIHFVSFITASEE